MGPSTKMTVSNVMVRQQAAMYLRVRSQRGSSLPVKIHQLCRRHQRADAGRKDVGVLGVKEEHLLFAPVPAHGQGNGLCAHDEQVQSDGEHAAGSVSEFFHDIFPITKPSPPMPFSIASFSERGRPSPNREFHLSAEASPLERGGSAQALTERVLFTLRC